MEGGGVNKEEKEAASPTCTKVATSLRDKMEPFFTKKKNIWSFHIWLGDFTETYWDCKENKVKSMDKVTEKPDLKKKILKSKQQNRQQPWINTKELQIHPTTNSTKQQKLCTNSPLKWILEADWLLSQKFM